MKKHTLDKCFVYSHAYSSVSLPSLTYWSFAVLLISAKSYYFTAATDTYFAYCQDSRMCRKTVSTTYTKRSGTVYAYKYQYGLLSRYWPSNSDKAAHSQSVSVHEARVRKERNGKCFFLSFSSFQIVAFVFERTKWKIFLWSAFVRFCCRHIHMAFVMRCAHAEEEKVIVKE